MSEANLCDRCGKIVKQDYVFHRFIKKITIKLLKIKPTQLELCDDCVKDFSKFMGFKNSEGKE